MGGEVLRPRIAVNHTTPPFPRWFATAPQEQIKAAIGETFELVASGILRIPEGKPLALKQFAEAIALAEAPAHGAKPLFVPGK
jgi:hypothetical protein